MKIRERFISINDIDLLTQRLPESDFKDAKRQLRKPLLEALDIYDKNVSKGRLTETESEKAEVDNWYRDICDLKDESFKNIPNVIKKYRG